MYAHAHTHTSPERAYTVWTAVQWRWKWGTVILWWHTVRAHEHKPSIRGLLKKQKWAYKETTESSSKGRILTIDLTTPYSCFWGESLSFFWGENLPCFWGENLSCFWGENLSCFWGESLGMRLTTYIIAIWLTLSVFQQSGWHLCFSYRKRRPYLGGKRSRMILPPTVTRWE